MKAGDDDKELDEKYERKVICMIQWTKLKKIVMKEKNTKQIKVRIDNELINVYRFL